MRNSPKTFRRITPGYIVIEFINKHVYRIYRIKNHMEEYVEFIYFYIGISIFLQLQF